MPLEGIDDIHGGDGLPLGVFSVGDSVPDDVLKEHLQDTPGLLIDEARDTLDSTTASQTADGGLGDALDVVPEDLAMTLSASLSESLASFATSSHVDESNGNDVLCRKFSHIYTPLDVFLLGELTLAKPLAKVYPSLRVSLSSLPSMKKYRACSSL